MKILTDKPAYKFAEFLLATGIVVLGGVVTQKALYLMTGDEISRIHRFDKNGQKGIVMDGDTLWMKTEKTPVPQAK